VEELAMNSRNPDPSFWRGKRVLVTGHSGFKGGWASLWLSQMGATVIGFALAPATRPNLFELCDIASRVESHIGDLRNDELLTGLVRKTQPDIVLHLGAQSLVRKSYASPLETFAVNTLGTANLLEAVRLAGNPAAVLVVTTDKVYENAEDGRAFDENDPLGGHDPYSASKAAAEIVTRSYARSFSNQSRIATARGGNVIGGGDFAEDRLVPDVWRAAQADVPVVVRYPDAIRPWQHVLDCLCGYFVFLEDLAQNKPVPHALNFAPDSARTLTVRQMVERLQKSLGARRGWQQEIGAFPAEMQALKLSAARAASSLAWRNRLNADEAVAWTMDWYRVLSAPKDIVSVTLAQIESFAEIP
jgi:CDP-glucose 4,6-dehydratase